jgi:hypothetical protein
MRRSGTVPGLVFAVGLIYLGCASTGVEDEGAPRSDGGGGGASLGPSGGGCQGVDTRTDLKNCGACGRACDDGQACVAGACVETQCAICGSNCVYLRNDLFNCGACGKSCVFDETTHPLPKLPKGTNNPETGIYGYDGGVGWEVAAPVCEKGKCEAACSKGLTACPDTICYDLSKHHENCGACGVRCAATEWCADSHCCPVGKGWCGGRCVDILEDARNCGGCGRQCQVGCSRGVCTDPVSFQSTFGTELGRESPQCAAWKAFQASLTGQYSKVVLSSSRDPNNAIECVGPEANKICRAIATNGRYAPNGCQDSKGRYSVWSVRYRDSSEAVQVEVGEVDSTVNPCARSQSGINGSFGPGVFQVTCSN